MKEIWKGIDGYEDKYEVSSQGRVRTIAKRNRWGDKLYPLKKPIYNKFSIVNGHLYVILTNNKKRSTCAVHRLVAKAFIDNPLKLPVINHKDENPFNNNFENLEWCTFEYNNRYGTVRERQRLSHLNHKSLSAPVICKKDGVFVAEYPSMNEAQRKTSALQSHIMQCCQGKRKTAGGYEWQYKYGRKKPLHINRCLSSDI